MLRCTLVEVFFVLDALVIRPVNLVANGGSLSIASYDIGGTSVSLGFLAFSFAFLLRHDSTWSRWIQEVACDYCIVNKVYKAVSIKVHIAVICSVEVRRPKCNVDKVYYAVVVQIRVTNVAIAVTIGIALIRVRHQRAIVCVVLNTVTVGIYGAAGGCLYA